MTHVIHFVFPSKNKTCSNCQSKSGFLSIYFESPPYDQRFKDKHMLESHSFFSKMVDELIEFSQYDPELADGIRWLDDQAQKKGITFYDMVFEVLYKHDVNSKAKEWLSTRN